MNRRKKIEVALLRDQIARLYLEGKIQAEIGEIVGLTQQAVSLHIKALEKEWLENASIDFDMARAEQLAKLDALERAHHESFAESKKDKSAVTEDSVSETVTRIQTRTVSQYGDPRFLSGILNCISKRCEILGLNAPTKIDSGNSITNGEGLVGLLREAKRVVAEQGFSLYEIPERDEQ